MRRFKVGDKLVRVREFKSIPVKGATYMPKNEPLTVRELDWGIDGKPIVRFEGITNPIHPFWQKEYGYCEHLFEPLIETTQQFVEVTYTKIIETTPKTCAS